MSTKKKDIADDVEMNAHKIDILSNLLIGFGTFKIGLNITLNLRFGSILDGATAEISNTLLYDHDQIEIITLF
jgi:hypothetical protein